MESIKYKWNYCLECRQDTKHTVLFSKKRSSDSPDDYAWSEFYEVVECNGCETLSFRHEFHDLEHSYVDPHGNEEMDVTVETFPKGLKNHKLLRSVYSLPEKIRTVYKETIMSFQARSYLLAGVGFRAIIEAICIEEKIKGSNLEEKINNLAKNRLITDKEKERLHSIRFLGNDSIHDMEVPTDQKLYIVLEIVEHLLRNLYLLDKEAKSVLDTAISKYDDFEELIWQCCRKMDEGDEKTIKEILGKHIRRLRSEVTTFETNFIQRIKSNEIEYLKLGAVKPSKTNSENQQHYIKLKTESFNW